MNEDILSEKAVKDSEKAVEGKIDFDTYKTNLTKESASNMPKDVFNNFMTSIINNKERVEFDPNEMMFFLKKSPNELPALRNMLHKLYFAGNSGFQLTFDPSNTIFHTWVMHNNDKGGYVTVNRTKTVHESDKLTKKELLNHAVHGTNIKECLDRKAHNLKMIPQASSNSINIYGYRWSKLFNTEVTNADEADIEITLAPDKDSITYMRTGDTQARDELNRHEMSIQNFLQLYKHVNVQLPEMVNGKPDMVNYTVHARPFVVGGPYYYDKVQLIIDFNHTQSDRTY